MQRKEKSSLVLEAYWKWLNTIPRPTGKLKDAVTYKRCDACCPNMVQRTFFAIGLRNKNGRYLGKYSMSIPPEIERLDRAY